MVFRMFILSLFLPSCFLNAIEVYDSVVDPRQSEDLRAVVKSSYGQYEVTEIRSGDRVLGEYYVSKSANCHLSNQLNANIETAKTQGKLVKFRFASGISYGSCGGAMGDGFSLQHNPNPAPIRAVAGLEELEAQLESCHEQIRALSDTGVVVNRGFEDDLLRRVKEMQSGSSSGTKSFDAN